MTPEARDSSPDTHRRREIPALDNGIVKVMTSKVMPGELGVEAKSKINAGQLIFKIKGPVVDEATIYTFQVGQNKHLDPKDEEGRPSFGHYTNHSCDPSACIRIISCNGEGKMEVIARKDINPGEEVTFDYATTEYDPKANGLQCKCSAGNCRGAITGYKNLPKDIKDRYRKEGIVSPFLIKIEEQDREVIFSASDSPDLPQNL